MAGRSKHRERSHRSYKDKQHQHRAFVNMAYKPSLVKEFHSSLFDRLKNIFRYQGK